MTIQYLTNEQGECTAVQISIRDWEKIQKDLEMLEDIRAYQEAVEEGLEFVPFEQAFDSTKENNE